MALSLKIIKTFIGKILPNNYSGFTTSINDCKVGTEYMAVGCFWEMVREGPLAITGTLPKGILKLILTQPKKFLWPGHIQKPLSSLLNASSATTKKPVST